MCFNAEASITTFILGLTGCILLIKYPDPKFINQNITSGIFLISISMIQLMDFLLWIDIDNKLGINKVTTTFGPILNICSPLFVYIIKYIYYKPNILSMKNMNLPVMIINLIYLLLFIKSYKNFLNKGDLITKIENGHLKWPWLNYSNGVFYIILLAINIFYLYDFKYASLIFSITYIFLLISYKFFNYSKGELWCFFGAFIPFILLVFQKIL